MENSATNLVLPDTTTLANARSCLHKSLPADGLGEEKALEHIRRDLVPALSKYDRHIKYLRPSVLEARFLIGLCTPCATRSADIGFVHLLMDLVSRS